MRSLWTSASGMKSMQTQLDTLAQNMANLNTAGYKAQSVQFKDALTQQMNQKTEESNLVRRDSNPGLRLGHGVLPMALMGNFTQGSLQDTGNGMDVALDGDGFFKVGLAGPGGTTPKQLFTRDGSFKVGMVDDGAGNKTPYLVDGSGRYVLDDNDQPIDLTGYDMSKLVVKEDGTLLENNNGFTNTIATLGIVQVDHPEENLDRAGENLYALRVNVPNTAVTARANITNGAVPNARQGFIEQSNVDMSTEMTEMLVAQRAYTMNTKALQTADQMMGIANNLRNG
ncbi:MAG: flagellar hook-basal body protein [Tumebacillaceae bacterium]